MHLSGVQKYLIVSQFLTSVSSLHSMKCLKRHNDAHYTTLMEKMVEILDPCV